MATSFAAATLMLSLHLQTKSSHVSSTLPTIISSPKAVAAATDANSRTHLVVDLSDRTVSLYEKSKVAAVYPVAIGQAGWETPTGTFAVREMHVDPDWEHPITGEIVPAGPDNPLGNRWIGFWSDGINQIGFHGTNQTHLIGQAVSHGCIRMLNVDVEAMYAQVKVGTPVVVRP